MKNQPDDTSHGCVSDSLRAQAARCHRPAYAISDQQTKEILPLEHFRSDWNRSHAQIAIPAPP